MPETTRSRHRALTVSLLLLVSLPFASCQMLKRLGGGGGALDEANQLNRSAGEDIRQIEKIAQENKHKESEVSRALNSGQLDAAKRLMDDSIKAIDSGLEKAERATGKFNRAAALDVDPTIKEYLALRARAVQSAIEAFRELRRGIIVFREAAGSTNRATTDRARNEIQQSSAKFDRLISETQKLELQADQIARRNPDKIKPGH